MEEEGLERKRERGSVGEEVLKEEMLRGRTVDHTWDSLAGSFFKEPLLSLHSGN